MPSTPSRETRTVLIVGASRGLGHAMAAEFVDRGWNVIGTVRAGSRTALHDLAERHPGRVEVETLEINEQAQIAVLRERLAGRALDILFVNAGIGVTEGGFLPRIGLSALFGAVSPQLDTLTTSKAGLWSAGAQLTGPIFQGGGLHGQADAVRLGLARALLQVDEGLRIRLRQFELLTRDPREVERKKPGRPKARKRFQFSKR